MCLILSSNGNVLNHWMQDVIFCIPGQRDDPGRKIVITTVALEIMKGERNDLFLYYADEIEDPGVIDLHDTLLKKDFWLNTLSAKCGQLDPDYGNKVIQVPSPPKYGGATSNDFSSIGFRQTPQLIPNPETKQLANKSKQGKFPFTKVILHARAAGLVIIRFGFSLPNDPEEVCPETTSFQFLGPEPILSSIQKRILTYSADVNNNWPDGEPLENRDQLLSEIDSAAIHLAGAAKNGRYHLLLASRPTDALLISNASKIVPQATRNVRSHWIKNERCPKCPDDFNLEETEEKRIHMLIYESHEQDFNILGVARRLS